MGQPIRGGVALPAEALDLIIVRQYSTLRWPVRTVPRSNEKLYLTHLIGKYRAQPPHPLASWLEFFCSRFNGINEETYVRQVRKPSNYRSLNVTSTLPSRFFQRKLAGFCVSHVPDCKRTLPILPIYALFYTLFFLSFFYQSIFYHFYQF